MCTLVDKSCNFGERICLESHIRLWLRCCLLAYLLACLLAYLLACLLAACLLACLLVCLLASKKCNVVVTQGQTALHWAARRGYATVVAELLRHGADVHAVDCEVSPSPTTPPTNPKHPCVAPATPFKPFRTLPCCLAAFTPRRYP